MSFTSLSVHGNGGIVEALLKGVLAGYGIAIPVGAIAVLIVQVGIRCGFRCAASAGAGAATADLVYSVVAVTAGTAVAGSIESLGSPLRLVSGGVLALIGIWGLYRGRHAPPLPDIDLPGRADYAATYTKFLGLTLINPLTVVYFAAFILGSGLAENLTSTGAVFFVAGPSWPRCRGRSVWLGLVASPVTGFLPGSGSVRWLPGTCSSSPWPSSSSPDDPTLTAPWPVWVISP